jgi:flagellar basal-body rod modification protein FlgD
MTYIPEISQSYTTQARATATTEKDSSQTLGQDEFLTLLVAQMQNQDPLNPTDATEWTAQLAQYSQLEQSMHLNDTMEVLVDGQKTTERLSALSLIGKEAVVEGSTFSLGGETAEIGYKIDGEVTGFDMEIHDSLGNRVATLHPSDLSQGNHFITWDGLDENGEHLPPGDYELVRTEVTGVDLGETGAVLITDSGEYPLASIYGVYEQTQTAPDREEDNAGAENENEISAATDGAGIVEEADAVLDDGDEVIDAAATAIGG